jgi:hypothetical protein
MEGVCDGIPLPVYGQPRRNEHHREQQATHDCAGAVHPRNGQTPIEIVSAISVFVDSVHWQDIVTWLTQA